MSEELSELYRKENSLVTIHRVTQLTSLLCGGEITNVIEIECCNCNCSECLV